MDLKQMELWADSFPSQQGPMAASVNIGNNEYLSDTKGR